MNGGDANERDDRESQKLKYDYETNNDEKEEEHEENAVGEGGHHSSTATVTSSSTSQTDSTGSKKSRRASLQRDKLARSYDPMQVVTPEQLDAFSLLVSTPIWIFDFIKRKNRYANPAGLDIWSAQSLEEFLSRSMSDMSAASVARTQECQNRIERAQVVQDLWTFYPKGKAKTVQMTMTAVRLSPDEDHCSILVVGNMITQSSGIGNTNFNSRRSFCGTNTNNTTNTNSTFASRRSFSVVNTNSTTNSSIISGNSLGGTAHTSTTASTSATSTSSVAKDVPNTPKDLGLKQNSSRPTTAAKSKCNHEKTEDSVVATGFEEVVVDDTKSGAAEDEKEEEKLEDNIISYDNDIIPLNHILDNSNHSGPHHQKTAMGGDNPLHQEILRGVEIIRHLPMAVCQFDMKGRVMFQNPAAYLPPLDDEEKESEDDESFMDDIDTDDESEYYERLFEQQYGGVQTIAANNGRGNFMDRFVNKKVAKELLESLQDEPKEKRSNSMSSNSSCGVVLTDTTVTVEAELHTSMKGRTQWSAIQLRKTKDPVTSLPVILYSAQDKSDAMEAKREREARLQKSEFLAIMAHEIRTPLHQVTGFIDLLELEACSNTITTTTSSGAISSTMNNKSLVTNANSKNAVFPAHNGHIDSAVINSIQRPNNVKKSRSMGVVNANSPRWPSITLPKQTIGNLTGEQRGYIKLLKTSANQLMTVINDVLDYSKLEAGKMKTERIPFELLSVVQGSMEAVRGSCEEKGLTLTLEYGGSDKDDYDYDDSSGLNNGIGRKTIRRRRSFDGKAGSLRSARRRKIDRTHSFNNKKKKNKCDGDNIKSNDIPFRILGDPNRLRQVLLNLLSNAVKFTEKGGIHVRVSSFTKKNIVSTVAAFNQEPRRRVSRRSSMSSTSTQERKESKTPRRSSMSSTTSATSAASAGEIQEEGRRFSRRSVMSANERREVENTSKPTIDNLVSSDKVPKEKTNPRSLRIVITDSGMGISKEQQNTIFEKYQQANLSVARNFGGTGLGLSICKLLVEKNMGGSIGVDSEEGQGSSFYITLPIEVPRETNDDASRGANLAAENQKNGASMNVLVAEDNKINQKLVANMLKRMGHKSTLVENGRQAIDMIVKHHPPQENSSTEFSSTCMGFDAILMDIQMPVMDGLEATRRLRTMGYTDLPILGLTASVKRSDYEELGFTDWLPKPILMKDLKAKLLKLYDSEDSDESIAK